MSGTGEEEEEDGGGAGGLVWPDTVQLFADDPAHQRMIADIMEHISHTMNDVLLYIEVSTAQALLGITYMLPVSLIPHLAIWPVTTSQELECDVKCLRA